MSEENLGKERWPSLDMSRVKVIRELVAGAAEKPWLTSVLKEMDQNDVWAIDYQEVAGGVTDETVLESIRNVVEKFASVVHAAPVELGCVLSHLTSTRCLYLMSNISQRNDRVLSVLGGEVPAAEDADVQTIAARVAVMDRLQVLDKIFSRERLIEVAEIMRSVRENG